LGLVPTPLYWVALLNLKLITGFLCFQGQTFQVFVSLNAHWLSLQYSEMPIFLLMAYSFFLGRELLVLSLHPAHVDQLRFSRIFARLLDRSNTALLGGFITVFLHIYSWPSQKTHWQIFTFLHYGCARVNGLVCRTTLELIKPHFSKGVLKNYLH